MARDEAVQILLVIGGWWIPCMSSMAGLVAYPSVSADAGPHPSIPCYSASAGNVQI